MKPKKLIKLLYPPLWLTVLLTLICTAALVYIFTGGYDMHPLAFASYVLSFYTLTVIVLRCIEMTPKHYRRARERVYSDPIGGRYMTDMHFRTHISLYSSLAVNVIYIAFNALSGLFYHSAWFFVLAFYYSILAAMRFLLVRFVHRAGIGTDRINELRRSRLCGYILLTVNLALSGTVLMILYQNKGFEYNGILIYAVAAYTFYITAAAAVNLVKYRRLGSPVMSMTKIISMAAALVSVLSLETAMLSQFGREMSEENKQLFIILTGAGISIAIAAMSVFSIVKNSREIKKISESDIYAE